MKILYGVQGTGNGHITRARHMAKGFAQRKDIQVDYFFSGRKPDQYFDMQEFGSYSHGRGFTFVTQNGRIHHRKTVLNNNLCHFLSELKSQNLSGYDLVINDFEPITAWAAKRAGIPSISLSHQAAFLHQVPVHQQTIIDKAITKYFAPTQYRLGTHWYHFGYDIIPPFVASELRSIPQKSPILHGHKLNGHKLSGDNILVYLPFENLSLIQEHLHVLSDYNFTCYHPLINHDRQDKNIQWKRPASAPFKTDLIGCDGVISNCGFELSTECLSLGKPLLVKPLNRQYEQLSNAYTLKNLGLCHVLHTINVDEIDDWLQNKQGIQIEYPSDCSDFIDWIVDGNWTSPETICERLWKKVKFPVSVNERLYQLSTQTKRF